MPSRPAMLRGLLTWDEHDEMPPPSVWAPPVYPEHPWVPPCGAPAPLPPDAEPELIYPADLIYQGCFRLPSYPVRYDFPPKGLCYSAAHDSLFLSGFADYHGLGEISIPPPIT